MTAANLLNWALQIGVLVAVTAAAIALLRISDPTLRLRAWRVVLALAVLLPLLQPWQIVFLSPGSAPEPGAASLDASELIIAILIAGAALRALWLMIGLRKLRLLRERADAWTPSWFSQRRADLRVSREIESAVTFGFRAPVILAPRRLLTAPEPHQRAVVAHELRHVERRDWLWVLGEEALRTACWFHPAVWFALDQAQLAREEVVDRETILVTGNAQDYLEALVAAASGPSIALGFGPQFFRRRQLKTRIRRLLKENTMSTRGILVAAATLTLVAAGTIRTAAAAFPLITCELPVVEQAPPPPPPPPPAPAVPAPGDQKVQPPAFVPPPPPPPPPPPAPSPKSKRVVAVMPKQPKKYSGEAPPPPPKLVRFKSAEPKVKEPRFVEPKLKGDRLQSKMKAERPDESKLDRKIGKPKTDEQKIGEKTRKAAPAPKVLPKKIIK